MLWDLSLDTKTHTQTPLSEDDWFLQQKLSDPLTLRGATPPQRFLRVRWEKHLQIQTILHIKLLK